MLKKLLKYDLKSVLSVWWIPAVSAVLLSLVAAGCMYIIGSDRQLPQVLVQTAYMTRVLISLVVLCLGPIASILACYRFYKNFFTDEGYLTFTLPVTRRQLLDSKLFTQVLVSLMSGLVIVICYFLVKLVAFNYSETFFEGIKWLFKEVGRVLREEEGGYWLIIWIVQISVIGLLSTVFSVLFADCCITFGSMIAKKAKLTASIGVYLGANWLFSGITNIFMVCGAISLGVWMESMNLEEQMELLLMGLLLACGIAIMGLLCSLLYTLLYWMLDRKLNLP